MGAQIFFPHAVKCVGAQFHYLHHVFHDAEDLLVILAGEDGLRFERASGLDLLDLRGAPGNRNGVGSGHAFAFLHRQSKRRRHAGIGKQPVFPCLELRSNKPFELAVELRGGF